MAARTRNRLFRALSGAVTRGPLQIAAAVAILIGALVGPAVAQGPGGAAFAGIVSRAIEGHALPAARAFADAAAALERAMPASCPAAGGASPDLRRSFRSLAAAWGRLAAARFGPLAQASRLESLAFWPDTRGVIDRQLRLLLRSLPESGTGDWIGEQSAAVQGLPAFDRLAFDEPGLADPGRCRFAAAVAGNIARLASEVAAGFADPDLVILNPGPENALYRTDAEAVAELFRALATQAEILGDTIIRMPMGNRPEDAKPSRVFLRFAPATIDYMLGALDGLDAMIAAMGLEQALPESGARRVDAAQFELSTARRMIESLPGDAETLVSAPDARGRLTTAALALQGFRHVVDRELAVALGLTTGFNSLDGD